MASSAPMTSPVLHRSADADDLLLRETNHRCSNDLQLVVSLLALQSRRVASPEARQALSDVMERVAILARARGGLHGERPRTCEAAVRQVCEALQSQAEPRSILISLETRSEAHELSARHVTALALVVNELATNAIKHGFADGGSGVIKISIRKNARGDLIITVADDGLPFSETATSGDGFGLGLAKRLMDSIGGLFIPPPSGSKAFELRVPASRIERSFPTA